MGAAGSEPATQHGGRPARHPLATRPHRPTLDFAGGEAVGDADAGGPEGGDGDAVGGGVEGDGRHPVTGATMTDVGIAVIDRIQRKTLRKAGPVSGPAAAKERLWVVGSQDAELIAFRVG